MKVYVFMHDPGHGCPGTERLYEAIALAEDGRIVHYDTIVRQWAAWNKFVHDVTLIAAAVDNMPPVIIEDCESPENVESFKHAVELRRERQAEQKRKAQEDANRARQEQEIVDRAVRGCDDRTAVAGNGEGRPQDRPAPEAAET